VEAQRCSPGEVIELRLEQSFEDPAGRFVHLDVPPPTDPSRAIGELVGVGFPKFPFDSFGDLVGVNCSQSGKGETFGLIRQFGVGCEVCSLFGPGPPRRPPGGEWGKTEPGPVGRVQPSGDRFRPEVDVGERDRFRGPRVSATGDQTAPLVPLLVEGDDLDGYTEHGRRGRGCYLVLEHLEEPRELLVGVIRVDGDLVDELGERLRHGRHGTA
jgi:hypothetical protein